MVAIGVRPIVRMQPPGKRFVMSNRHYHVWFYDRLGLTIWVYQRAFETPTVMLPDEES